MSTPKTHSKTHAPRTETKDRAHPLDPLAFTKKLMTVLEQAQPILKNLLEKYKAPDTALSEMALDPAAVRHATAEFWGHYLRHPSQLVEMQLKYWQDMGHLWQESTKRFLGEHSHPLVAADPSDRRFRDPAWTESAVFDFIRQSYLLTRNAVQDSLTSAEGLSPEEKQKLDFHMRQFLDALSPSNFAATNPEVLKETLRTGGENLIKGLQNLIEDMKRGDGTLKIRTTQPGAFVLGKNIAATPGEVIFKNRMAELIHYAPTTPTAQKIPLLIVPPWINKYYILDLRAENSFVRFALDQGFSVFILSWVNPDKTYADVTFDEYMDEGILTALDQIEKVTGEKQTNVVGYCIGGTLTAMTMAWLAAKKKSSRIASATLLTTLLDFEGAGDLKVFTDDEQIDLLEKHIRKQGYLEAAALQKTFATLRANDMIWSFVVNNYMLGREPFPFDLLYWNEDSTNLPAAMHIWYLRHLYLKNDLIKPGKVTVNSVKIDLTKIKTPCYFLSTREDHIAPWKATYSGAQLIAKNADVRFVLSASGHVAGVINPPAAKKYGCWHSEDLHEKPDAWLESTSYDEKSWWLDWAAWLKKRSGPMVPARKPSKSLAAAPGAYVFKRG